MISINVPNDNRHKQTIKFSNIIVMELDNVAKVTYSLKIIILVLNPNIYYIR